MMTEIYDGNQAQADIILNPPTERRLIPNTEKLQAEQQINLPDRRYQNHMRIGNDYNRDLAIECQQNSSFNNTDRSQLQREEMMRNELSLQGQNQALEVADRKRIFKHAVIQFFIHAFVFIALLMILRYAKEQA